MLICLLAWGVLYAPELQRASQAQPDGLRRSVSLALLAPVAWVSDAFRLTVLTDGAARALGRDPDAPVGGAVGDIPVEVDDLPSAPPGGGPSKPPVRDRDIREPTAERRLRIAVVGDSLAAGIGYFAERVFKPLFTDVVKRGRISTGLARPDFFDWPAEMQFIVDRFRPDLTIVMLGENDNQGLRSPSGDLEQGIGELAWAERYEERVERFAQIATSGGGHVVWIGLPNERSTQRWALLQRQNDAFEAVADRLPNVGYFDTWSAFAADDGGYTAYFRDGNKVKLIRTDDGIHFNADGYTIVMRQVALFVTGSFGLHPKTYDA